MKINILKLEEWILKLGVVSAMFGVAISYNKLYLFHIVLIFFLAYVFFLKRKLDIFSLKASFPVVVFFLFSVCSLMWSNDMLSASRNIFYIFCGLLVCFIVISYARISSEGVGKVARVFLLFSIINFFIGFLETLSLIRLPISPYSNYVSLFGYSGSELDVFSEMELSYILSKPTGFNWNPNNFGFVFIITFPFLFFNNTKLKIISVFFLIWFNVFLQSRGLFLATLFFAFCWFFFSISCRNKFVMMCFFFVALIVSFVVVYVYGGVYIEHVPRIFQVFDSLYMGSSSLLDLNNVNLQNVNSTEIRSYIYKLGIISVLECPWVGLGVGGAQLMLESVGSPITSFHFYFLEILVEYGVIFYVLFLIFYVYMLRKLYYVHSKYNNNLAKSCFFSLLVLPVASISPSSIIYILCLWVIIGMSLFIIQENRERDNI